jgi:tetratricopeptide (TPR) repeat protein
MKNLAQPLAAFAVVVLCVIASAGLAEPASDEDPSAAVQAIGARARAEITRVGNHGVNVDRALSWQAQGDQALRRGQLALAAEDYGRARESVSVLDRQRQLALTERSRAATDLERAQRHGDDIAWAAAKLSDGNRAFASGNYVTADIDYAEARTDLGGD